MTTFNSDGIPIHNSKVLVSSASGVAVYAGSLPVPVSDPNNRKGWYYAKTAGAEKFNYYYYGEGSRPIQLREVKEYYFVGAVDTYVNHSSLPFLIVYTKPLGDGQDGGSWYRTRIIYSLPTSELIQLGIKAQFSSVANTGTRFPYAQKHLSTVLVTGPNNPAEEILTMSVHSDSAADNGAKILISHVGYELHNRDEKVNILLSA